MRIKNNIMASNLRDKVWQTLNEVIYEITSESRIISENGLDDTEVVYVDIISVNGNTVIADALMCSRDPEFSDENEEYRIDHKAKLVVSLEGNNIVEMAFDQEEVIA